VKNITVFTLLIALGALLPGCVTASGGDFITPVTEFANLENNPAPSSSDEMTYKYEIFETEENIIQNIDDRLALLKERHIDLDIIQSFDTVIFDNGNWFRTLYGENNAPMYRAGALEYYAPIEGPIVYELYYDEEGGLIYAYVVQYRYPVYDIYFHNNEVIRLLTGYGIHEEFDMYMVNAIAICLENAYRDEYYELNVS